MRFPRNMSNTDRVIRGVLGTIFIVGGPVFELDTLSISLLTSVGIMGIFSSILGYCMFYHSTGLSSLPRPKTTTQ